MLVVVFNFLTLLLFVSVCSLISFVFPPTFGTDFFSSVCWWYSVRTPWISFNHCQPFYSISYPLQPLSLPFRALSVSRSILSLDQPRHALTHAREAGKLLTLQGAKLTCLSNLLEPFSNPLNLTTTSHNGLKHLFCP